MNYSKDLLTVNKKSKLALILSVLFFLIAMAWIPLRLIDEGSISAFDWFYTAIMFLNGLSQSMAGLGYSIERLIGKAFVGIDHQAIRIKPGAFDKEQRIEWSEIGAIDYKPSVFIITKKNQTTDKLSMRKLEYSLIQEIKHVIDKMAHEKDIPARISDK